MKLRLNNWQRGWMLLSCLLLGVIFHFDYNVPSSDPLVENELNSEECKYLRDLPRGFLPNNTVHTDDRSPLATTHCAELARLMERYRLNLKGEGSYHAFLIAIRLNVIGSILWGWLRTIFWLYCEGWIAGKLLWGFVPASAGRRKLWQVFWVGILAAIMSTNFIGYGRQVVLYITHGPAYGHPTTWPVDRLWWQVLAVLYFLGLAVMVWRCRLNSSDRRWGYLAEFVVILAVLANLILVLTPHTVDVRDCCAPGEVPDLTPYM